MLAVVDRVRNPEVPVAVALTVLAAVAVGARPLLIGLVWLAAVTPPLVETDLARHRLPDAVVLPGYPVVLAALVLDGWARGYDALPAVLAGAGSGLVLLLLHVTGGLGFGDPKPQIGTVSPRCKSVVERVVG